jgi:asparagine synthase (glutamine-hydrolysing)
MCGIAGVFNFKDDRPADAALVESMTDVLTHRGPDDRGFYFSGPLGLGMRRLSIIDLEGGGQPIGNEDGSVQIVFNGAIYNHRALRRDLEARGHRFRTRSDTEAIVHGYEEFGPEVVQRLNGMFAFALWDASLRRLFVARDRLGIKPFYYAETASGVVFASELKGILEAPDVDTDLDPVALQQYLAWEYIPSPGTPFRSVRKLLPSTRLLVDRNGLKSQTYWQLSAGAPIGSLAEAEEGLRWHLQRSVRLRLEADVPVGAFLSGGLDSSILVATLASMREQPPHTFSIGFAEDDFNEVRYARAVAERFGTRHEEEILRPNCLDLIEEVAGFLDEPFADNSIIPTYLVSRLARRSVKVALSGDGADELFGGYDRYKADRIAASYSRLPSVARSAIARWLGDAPDRRPSKRGTLRTRLRNLGNALVLPAQLEHARWMVRSTAPLQLGFLRSAVDPPEDGAWMAPWSDAFRQSPFGSGLARQLAVDVRTYLLDDILFKTDRASMAASLEARVPYLDHELVEYAFRIPDRWKLRRLVGKWILRRAFSGRVPPEVLRRRKSGFSIPIASWLRGDLRDLAGDLLAPDRLGQQGIFAVGMVGALLQAHSRGQADHSRTLWALVMFQLWFDRFAQRKPGRQRVAGPLSRGELQSGVSTL